MPAASGTVTANTAATAAQYNNLRKDLVTSQLSYLTSVSGTNTIVGTADAVSYTHLTLPTNREV